MTTNNLFKVLVLGGAMITGPSALAQETAPVLELPIVAEAELTPVFCNANPTETCELNSAGLLVAKEGLECCWGTSCEAE